MGRGTNTIGRGFGFAFPPCFLRKGPAKAAHLFLGWNSLSEDRGDLHKQAEERGKTKEVEEKRRSRRSPGRYSLTHIKIQCLTNEVSLYLVSGST